MPTETKPRITVVSDTYARVSYRGLSGALNAVSEHSWEAILWLGTELPCSGETVLRFGWDSKSALEALVRAFDLVADCRDLAILVDRLEGAGLRTRISQIGGDKAIAAFDKALGFIQRVSQFTERTSQNDIAHRTAAAMVTVNGMIKTASAKRAPKPVKVTTTHYRTSYDLTVIPGFSVTFDADGRAYHIGESCETGSYNLIYFGTIERITAKTIQTRDSGASKARRMKISEFADRNHDGMGPKFTKNAETMQYI